VEYDIDNIVNSISDCLMIVDKNRKIKTVNKKLEKYMGISKDEFINNIMCGFFLFINKDDEKVCPLIDSLKNKESMDFSYPEYRLVINNNIKLVDGRVDLIKEAGEIVGAVISFKDITEKIETEEKLIESEKKFKSLYTAMVNSYTLRKVIYDENGEPYDYLYLEVNPAYEKLIGKSRDEIIGKTYRELFPESDTFWIKSNHYVTMRGESKVFEGYVPSVDKYLRTYVFMVTDELSGFIATDISKQKELEELLEKERELFKQLFTSMDNAYALCEFTGDKDNIEFKFLEVNPQYLKYVNKSREEVINKKNSEIFSQYYNKDPKASKEVLDAYYEAAINHKTQRFDIYSSLMNRYLEVIVYGQGDNKFAVEYIDISERKKLQENLRKEKERYSDLFNTMSEGFVLLDLIYGDSDTPIDFRIINLNPKGEEIIDSSFDNIVGLKASNFFKKYGCNEKFSLEKLIDLYNRVDKNLNNRESGILTKAFGKTLDISAFKPSDNSFAILFRDVTKQNELEKQIKLERELLDLMFNTSLSAFAILEMIYDGNGEPVDYIFTKVNPKYLELGDYKEEDIIGVRASELYEVDFKREGSMFYEYVKVLKTGKPISTEFYSIAYQAYLDINVTKVKENTLAISFSDITEKKMMQDKLHENLELLKKSQKELSKSEAMFRAILSNTTDAVLIYDKNLNNVFRSDNVKKILGWDKKHFESTDGFSLLHPEDKNRVIKYMKDIIKEGFGAKLEFEARILKKSGEYIYTKNSMVNLIDESNINGILINYSDISEIKKRESEIVYLSNYDALTGLYNRSYFERNLEEIDIKDNLPLSIIIGDLNGLKLVNDMFGHSKGDEILVKMAAIIKSLTIKDYIPIRYGGDEYLIVLPKTTKEEANQLIRNIKDECENYKASEDNEIFYLSIALGCSSKESKEKELSEVLKEAEDYMYKDKLFEGRSVHSATSLVSSIKTALHEKSDETEEHSARLARYSVEVGRKYNLLDYQLKELAFAAELHDIGKIGVDDRILIKEGKLTDDEWEKVKEHPAVGYRIAKASPELSSIADYILYHHEKWDGSGYPFGLKGQDIPLYSRIIAVIDAYDVMTSGRPYKKAMTKEEALAELETNKGTQFDPKVVDIFINEVLE